MKYTVKLNCHDWPHRGDASKREVIVDAANEVEATQLGLLQAAQNWPGAKLRAFDVVRDRLEAHAMKMASEAVVPRETPAPKIPLRVRTH